MKLKKILQEIGQAPRYSAVLLDENSKNLLIEKYKDKFPVDWKVYAHHQTIDPFGLVRQELVGTHVNLTVTHYGKSDKAFAAKVSGYKGPTNNAFPHVTIAVNISAGGKPKDSNSITEWVIEETPIKLNGTIENL